MSMNKIKEVFDSLKDSSNTSWELLLLRYKTTKKLGTTYFARKIEIYPETSFEKFLSKYSPSKPIRPSIIPEIPIWRPITTSIKKPNIIPNIKPSFLPANNPIHSINITNRFGFTFAIVNQVKKFDWMKYIIKKLTIINSIDKNFFKLHFFLSKFFYLYISYFLY